MRLPAPRWSTHSLDLGYKLAVEGLSLGAALGAVWIAYTWDRASFYLLTPGVLSFTALGGLTLYVLFRTLLTRLLPPWTPTFLYVNLMLGTKVSAREAGLVAFLFDGSLNGRWYPLTSIRRLPEHQRRSALFRFARELVAPPPRPAPPRRSRRDASPPPPPEPPDPLLPALRELGLTRRPASLAELKKAHRRLLSRRHPDRFAHEGPEARAFAEESSKRLNAAYDALAKTYGGR